VCYSVWDVHNKSEVRKLDFSAAVNDIELSADKKILTVAYSNKVAFWDIQT
jgi:WD40 repeat protein